MIANGVQISGVTQKRQTAGYQPVGFGGGMHTLTYDDGWDKRFTWYDVPKMKRDPMVLMGLAIREAPLHGVKLVAQANSPVVEAFVQKTITRVWQRALRKIVKMSEYGHTAGETEYKVERGRYRFHQLHTVAPLDARPLRDVNSRDVVGVRIKSIIGKQSGETDLAMPNAFWAAHEPEYGQPYGTSILTGAREPWMEKAGRHGANEIRRLWFVKNAFHSGFIRYPLGETLLPDGSTIDNQDLSRQILTNLETGGIIVLPSTRDGADGKGDFQWFWEPAAASKDVANILEYPDKLDELILIGMCIPPEVMEAGVKGSWSGRATTMQMFFSSLDIWITSIIDAISRLILKPLVLINFGPKAEFEVLHESLAEQAGKEPDTVTEKVQGQDTGGGLGPDPMKDVVGAVRGQPPIKRMSLNSIIEDNPKLYESIKAFSRGLWPTGGETRLSTEWKESEHPRDDDGTFAEKGAPSGGGTAGDYHVVGDDASGFSLSTGKMDYNHYDTREEAERELEEIHKNDAAYRNAGPETKVQLAGGGAGYPDSGTLREIATAAKKKLGQDFVKIAKKQYSKGDLAGWGIEVIRKKHGYHGLEHVTAAAYKIPVDETEPTKPATVPAEPPSEIDAHADTVRALYDRSGTDLTITPAEIDDTLAPLSDMSKTELLTVAKKMELRGYDHKPRAVIEAAIRMKILDRRSAAQRDKMIQSDRLSNWDESKHPRGQPENKGEFTSGGGATVKEEPSEEPASKPAKEAKPKLTPEEKAKAASESFEKLMATKEPKDADAFRRAKADGVAIPPAWTDVVYHGKDQNILAEGRDDKGRKQRAENPEYRQNISNENNARISKDLKPRMDKLREQLKKDAVGGNEEAKVLYLISLTGFRIGGKGDGKAKEQAYGASTLTGDHVTVDGDTVTFDFKGKKGVRQQHSVTDPVVAGMMKDIKPGQPVFKTRDTKVREAWQSKYKGEKVHDIRHVVATEIAEQELDKRIPPPPKTEKQKTAIMKEVAAVAAHTLGNDPAQTLGTYIDPRLWDKAKVAA